MPQGSPKAVPVNTKPSKSSSGFSPLFHWRARSGRPPFSNPDRVPRRQHGSATSPNCVYFFYASNSCHSEESLARLARSHAGTEYSMHLHGDRISMAKLLSSSTRPIPSLRTGHGPLGANLGVQVLNGIFAPEGSPTFHRMLQHLSQAQHLEHQRRVTPPQHPGAGPNAGVTMTEVLALGMPRP